jgi:hypothetical protein
MVVSEVAQRDAEWRRRLLALLVRVAPRDQLVPDPLRASKMFGELGVGIAVPNLGFDLIELLVRGERKRGAPSPASSALTK